MKQGLQFRLNQQLALTPQLQQAIRLLQLSSLELGTELRLMADANPLLVMDDFEDDPGVAEKPGNEQENERPADDGPDEYASEPDDSPLRFEASLPGSSQGNGSGESWQNTGVSSEESLREHLLWQLNLGAMQTSDQAIAIALIDAVDHDGYLRIEDADIQTTVAPDYHVNQAQIEAVRQQLLRFDPPGIACRDLRECLTVQLELLYEDSPVSKLALRIIADELELLARADMQQLAHRMHTDEETLLQAVQLIRSMDPRPGSSFDAEPVEYIIPDAYAVHRNDRWEVALSPDCQPRLEINQHYCNLMGSASRDDVSYLRGQLQEARWLIKSLQSRADTILKVARCIVRAQSAFLDYGPEAMRPLVLREVAEEVELHESTVSRVTTRKFLHTPRGIFEFKYFFSSGVGTEDGGSASATAVQAMIRKLVDSENRRKPFSDQAMVKQLQERGIQVARRTVAKYRESLRIPNSSERVHME